MKIRRYSVLPALVLALAAIGRPGVALAAGIAKGPYLQNPTLSSIEVCWVSDDEVTGTVHYAEGAKATSLGGSVADDKPVRLHKVKITGLKAYTRYKYAVECSGDNKEGTFLTAAPRGQRIHFVAYGDNRGNDVVAQSSVLAQIVKFQPDFVINTGDIVADGTKEDLWTAFFGLAGTMLKDYPLYPAPGNHERDGLAYLRYFDVQREYSFDYGSAHFASIDTNEPESAHAAQEEWLKKDLADHQDVPWRIVFFHHTPYTCVDKPDRRVLAAKLAARLEPILQAGHVQLVLNGHDHDYQHHFAKGIHYVVTGGGGAPLYSVTPDTPYVKFAKMVHHDCDLTLDDQSITVRAVQANGNILDTFDILLRDTTRKTASR